MPAASTKNTTNTKVTNTYQQRSGGKEANAKASQDWIKEELFNVTFSEDEIDDDEDDPKVSRNVRKKPSKVDADYVLSSEEEVPTKRRGRPPKPKDEEAKKKQADDGKPAARRGPGRPRKVQPPAKNDEDGMEEEAPKPPPRKRGRPPKVVKTAEVVQDDEEDVELLDPPVSVSPPKPRRKVPIPAISYRDHGDEDEENDQVDELDEDDEDTRRPPAKQPSSSVKNKVEVVIPVRSSAPEKHQTSSARQGKVTSRGRFSEDWDENIMESPRKPARHEDEDRVTPPTPSPMKTPSRKRQLPALSSPMELDDVEDQSFSQSAAKKLRLEDFTTPPQSQRQHVGSSSATRFSQPEEDRGNNLFLDDSQHKDMEPSNDNDEDSEAESDYDEKAPIPPAGGPVEPWKAPKECHICSPAILEQMMNDEDLADKFDKFLVPFYQTLPPLRYVEPQMEVSAHAAHIEVALRHFKIPTVESKNQVKAVITAPVFCGAVNMMTANPKDYFILRTSRVKAIAKVGSVSAAEVFVSWGMHVSNDLGGTQVNNRQQKAIQLAFSDIHLHRLAGFAGAVRRVKRISIPTYNSGISFKTMPQSDGYTGSPRKTPSAPYFSASSSGKSFIFGPQKKKIKQQPQGAFYKSFIVPMGDQQILNATDDVPVWDLREYVQGSLSSNKIDVHTVMDTAPKIAAQDIPEQCILGVFYSIGYWDKNNNNTIVPNLNLNVFGLVVVASPHGTYKSKGKAPMRS
ncbi:hypothetical protein PsYK624_138210 [Phanerochaete sordida]|uniref:Uncharacterized protein n=1 Tax=Phanerochaete sordida TaxID=48140 RepID=A0A9P3LJQ1_9APHY|nr:hypothetical protein PsYK624_138210 [Phanerochaete sordida]